MCNLTREARRVELSPSLQVGHWRADSMSDLLWAALASTIGFYMHVSARARSNHIVYRLMHARAKVLWGMSVRMASWQPRASLSRPTPSCGDLGGSPSSAGGTLRRSQSHSTPCWRASWQRPPSTRPLLQPWDFALSARSAGPRLRARRAEIAFSTPSLPPQALSRPAPRGQHGEGTTSPPPGRAHCRWAGV